MSPYSPPPPPPSFEDLRRSAAQSWAGVPARPVPPENVVHREGFSTAPVSRPYFRPGRLRVRSWNPGAVVGWLVAWIFSGGRYGRFPLYREEAEWADLIEREKAETRRRGMSGYLGPSESSAPSRHQKPIPPSPPRHPR